MTTDLQWRRRLRPTSVRVRIMAWFVALLTPAVLGLVLLEHAILSDRLDEEVKASLLEEAEEVRVLAGGNDPETGEPYGGDVAAVFDEFLERNVPGEGEAFFTFVDGVPYRQSRQVPVELANTAAGRRWATLRTSETGLLHTEAGRVEYLAVPLLGTSDAPDEVAGVFVVANFLRQEQAEIDTMSLVGAAVAVATILITSAITWFVAGRIMQPLRRVTETARDITDTDLSHRIDVDGDDEIAELARTFNRMLDRLEAAFAGQRAFLDDAGHELRTPITIIRGQLEMLDEEPVDRDGTMRLVTDELDRMTRIVNDLLLLARAEQPDFVAPVATDTQELTDEVFVKLDSLGDRRWRLVEAGDGSAMIDPQRVTQAVMNVAANAVDATEPGDMIELGAETDRSGLRLWVRDEGRGIPPDERERIFDRFVQSGPPQRHDGVGLGLAITRAIVHAHGGTVRLVSAEGKGTTVHLWFPREGAPWHAS